MTKQWKPRRPTVELRPAVEQRPSRIRRDPVVAPAQKAVRPYPTEREVAVVVIGVILFALALTVLTFGISDITSH